MLNRGGLGGADNVFDDFKTGSTELVAVVDNVAHARLCSTGRVGGGLITFLTTLRQDPRNLPFDRPCTDTSNWPSSLQCKIGAA